MKKSGILNAKLSEIIAEMGHGDHLVICDAGLPIPRNMIKVDLALTNGVPQFLETLKAVLDEFEVESVIIAEEMPASNHGLYEGVKNLLPKVEIKQVPHDEFKSIYRNDAETAFVRTGETSPYANIILISGVTF